MSEQDYERLLDAFKLTPAELAVHAVIWPQLDRSKLTIKWDVTSIVTGGFSGPKEDGDDAP